MNPPFHNVVERAMPDPEIRRLPGFEGEAPDSTMTAFKLTAIVAASLACWAILLGLAWTAVT